MTQMHFAVSQSGQPDESKASTLLKASTPTVESNFEADYHNTSPPKECSPTTTYNVKHPPHLTTEQSLL